ncbi:MAG: alpha/beta hydrolase [Candidatus Omnitrophica bacterium]|nr:alpha/beta hydrolase [Candidatus Omnitrophota bacterium]
MVNIDTKVVMRIIFFLVAGFVLLIVYVRFLEAVSLFIPSRKITMTPKEVGLDFEDIYFLTQDHVQINGWLVKAKVDSDKVSTILFCHGNAGNIGDRVEKIQNFRDLGLNVFIFDYRGYGKSQGRPTEKGMYLDVAAALDYLQSRQDIAAERIIVYGASMGGVAAIDIVSKRPVLALIADSTFTSSADMAKTIIPFVPAFILGTKLDNATKIKGIIVPKLFIHSPSDETVPFRLGQKLFKLAPEPKEFLVISGNHNEGFILSQDIYLPGIENFLNKYNLR